MYSKDYLFKRKDGAYIKNLDKYESIGTHWIALYVNTENVTYFDSFGIEHILKKIENSLEIEILQCIFIKYKHMIQ